MTNTEIRKRLQWLKDNTPYGSEFIATIDKDYRSNTDHEILDMNIRGFQSDGDPYGKQEKMEVLTNANKLMEHLNLTYNK